MSLVRKLLMCFLVFELRIYKNIMIYTEKLHHKCLLKSFYGAVDIRFN